MSKTLFQRLRDGHSATSSSPSSHLPGIDAVPGDSLRELRESICENLRALLNSRCGMSEAEPAYGLPDLIDILWSDSGFGSQDEGSADAEPARNKKGAAAEWTDHGVQSTDTLRATKSAADTPENIQRGIKAIVKSIQTYEPRLASVAVKLARALDSGTSQLSMEFEISGRLAKHLGGQELLFETVIRGGTRQGVAVRESQLDQIGIRAK